MTGSIETEKKYIPGDENYTSKLVLEIGSFFYLSGICHLKLTF